MKAWLMGLRLALLLLAALPGPPALSQVLARPALRAPMGDVIAFGWAPEQQFVICLQREDCEQPYRKQLAERQVVGQLQSEKAAPAPAPVPVELPALATSPDLQIPQAAETDRPKPMARPAKRRPSQACRCAPPAARRPAPAGSG